MIAFSGLKDGGHWVHMDIHEGSYGGRAGKDAMDAVDTLYANTRNNPIEDIESHLPLRIARYELRDDASAAGRWRGGIGSVREVSFLGRQLHLGRGRRPRLPPLGLRGRCRGKRGGADLPPCRRRGCSFSLDDAEPRGQGGREPDAHRHLRRRLRLSRRASRPTPWRRTCATATSRARPPRAPMASSSAKTAHSTPQPPKAGAAVLPRNPNGAQASHRPDNQYLAKPRRLIATRLYGRKDHRGGTQRELMSQTERGHALRTAEFVPLVGLLMSLVALAIDAMLPALPAIGSDFGVSRPNDVQLVIMSLFLGLGIGQLLFGPSLRQHWAQTRRPCRPRPVHDRMPREHFRAHASR